MIAGPGEGETDHRAVAIDETIEDLPDPANKARRLGPLLHRWLKVFGELALVGGLGDEPQPFRTGLAKIDVHGISRNSGSGRCGSGLRRPLSDVDCD